MIIEKLADWNDSWKIPARQENKVTAKFTKQATRFVAEETSSNTTKGRNGRLKRGRKGTQIQRLIYSMTALPSQ